MHDFEQLGAFYLGRRYDLDAGAPTDEPVLYDARDLTTHAVCVGMTGSGKTGLGVALLEEAAIDGLPAIVIDPKGDLGNLLLSFPGLRAEDFRPWIDEGEAARRGVTPEAFAADRAEKWRSGLAQWGQDGARIERFRQAADVAIYTPGSSAGLPVSVLRSFRAPAPAVAADADALRERVSASVSGLLALLGIDADPIRSREHILLSNIVDHAWRGGRDLDIASLIGAIQDPPMTRVGVMDLESFYGAKDRFELAMSLNNLLASPAFAAWMEGDALDVERLLYTPDGRPRVSILSIAHLPDTERMFFVTILLNEIVAWMRGQPGTSSLRALLYMDEIFGFFPPVANPPSKTPMLTLLKQARAYGLGVVLATQNPVDLDYKGLSNTGTWFLGRLQTERDKDRVLDGLEGASATTGATFDRRTMDAMLSGLGSRVFLMNNVHEDEPVLFHTRWVMSYLRGPLTRAQIRQLMAPRRPAAPAAPAPGGGPARPAAAPAAMAAPAPVAASPLAVAPPLPPDVEAFFVPVADTIPADGSLVYRPFLLGTARMHYVRVAAGVDDWTETTLLAALTDPVPPDPWEEAEPVAPPALGSDPDRRGRFAPLPGEAAQGRRYRTWSRKLVDHLYRNRAVTIWHAKRFKLYSAPQEEEGHFRVRLRQLVHEDRDERVEKLRNRYGPKLATLRDRIRRAEQRVDVERSQARQAELSLGASLLGALFGRKTRSAGTVARGTGRAAQQRGDIGRAKENVSALRRKLEELEAEFESEIDEVRRLAEERQDLDAITVRPRKSDMSVRQVALVWVPWRVDAMGIAEPACAALDLDR